MKMRRKRRASALLERLSNSLASRARHGLSAPVAVSPGDRRDPIFASIALAIQSRVANLQNKANWTVASTWVEEGPPGKPRRALHRDPD
jgi:hypothetical protein